jgi:hypothetical protein
MCNNSLFCDKIGSCSPIKHSHCAAARLNPSLAYVLTLLQPAWSSLETLKQELRVRRHGCGFGPEKVTKGWKAANGPYGRVCVNLVRGSDGGETNWNALSEPTIVVRCAPEARQHRL